MARLKRLKIVVLTLCLFGLMLQNTALGGVRCHDRAAIRATARVEYPLGLTIQTLTDNPSENNPDSKNNFTESILLYAGTGEAQISLKNDYQPNEIIISPEAARK